MCAASPGSFPRKGVLKNPDDHISDKERMRLLRRSFRLWRNSLLAMTARTIGLVLRKCSHCERSEAISPPRTTGYEWPWLFQHARKRESSLARARSQFDHAGSHFLSKKLSSPRGYPGFPLSGVLKKCPDKSDRATDNQESRCASVARTPAVAGPRFIVPHGGFFNRPIRGNDARVPTRDLRPIIHSVRGSKKPWHKQFTVP